MDNGDDANDLISYEEVETWSIDALKEYCRKRSFKVSGSKKELIARVYVLYPNNAPEEADAKEQEASNRREYKSLFMCRIPAPDPHQLKTWMGEKEGMSLWPRQYHCYRL